MTIRTRAITGLVEDIQTATGYKGYRGLKFLHEINDFPSFYVHAGAENRTHYGAGFKLCIIDISIRSYNFTDNVVTTEDIARELETRIQQYRYTNTEIEEARVTSLSTDEGMMEPYSVCDINAQILYRIYKQ